MEDKKITYEDIERANELLCGTDIKGKSYIEVNQRIKAFRMIYPQGTIQTKMVSNEDGVCVFRAYIYDGDRLLGTGTAYEQEGSTFINKTSYIENCETSAVGRALGMCGFGIDVSVASAEEVQNAIANQGKDDTNYRALLIDYCNSKGLDMNEIAKQYKLNAKASNDMFKKVYMEITKGEK